MVFQDVYCAMVAAMTVGEVDFCSAFMLIGSGRLVSNSKTGMSLL
jgi:hypothetical protein